MKELRITKGEWQYRDHFSDGIIETEETIIGHLMKWGSPEDELQSNAVLIIDAGNTLQKCGLLPSELLQQRDELKEALKKIRDTAIFVRRGSMDAYKMQHIAEAAIKKTEPKVEECSYWKTNGCCLPGCGTDSCEHHPLNR